MFTKIKADYLQARKDKDKNLTSLLSTLIGELENSAQIVNGQKIVSEDSVIKTIKSWVKKYEDTINIPNLPEDALFRAQEESKIVFSYLPKQLSSDEIKEKILSADVSSMPEAMKYMKENFSGLYDGKEASRIAKEIFS